MNTHNLFTILSLLCRLLRAHNDSHHHLRLTALISDEHDPRARFECWEINNPFTTYPTVGEAVVGLANVSNVSYVVLPPRSEEGLHKPPHSMLFILLSGLAHVTLPEGGDELWIMEGVNGLMVAADVFGEGHFTEYPGDKVTMALQVPFAEGGMMEHRVVGKGVCGLAEKQDEEVRKGEQVALGMKVEG